MPVPVLTELLTAVSSRYYSLVLLVGPPASGKSSALKSLAAESGCVLVPLGRLVSGRLLELSGRDRSRKAAEVVAEVIAHEGTQATVILLDDIELLFSPSLALDPLRFLQSLARNRIIVAAWTGQYREEVLLYAEPGHPEHRAYRKPEAVIVVSGSGPSPMA